MDRLATLRPQDKKRVDPGGHPDKKIGPRVYPFGLRVYVDKHIYRFNPNIVKLVVVIITVDSNYYG